MKNLKEVVLYSENFKAQENLISFAKELGFNNIKDISCRMNEKFINFIKEHLEKHDINNIYKDINKKVGFNGFAYIGNVDTNKKWTVMYDSKRNTHVNDTLENIVYLNLYHQENNFMEIQIV